MRVCFPRRSAGVIIVISLHTPRSRQSYKQPLLPLRVVYSLTGYIEILGLDFNADKLAA